MEDWEALANEPDPQKEVEVKPQRKELVAVKTEQKVEDFEAAGPGGKYRPDLRILKREPKAGGPSQASKADAEAVKGDREERERRYEAARARLFGKKE